MLFFVFSLPCSIVEKNSEQNMFKLYSLLLIGLLSLVPLFSSAQTIYTQQNANAVSCWDTAARYQGLDPWLLYAVGYTESTHNEKIISRPNRNGTYDIGLMQINSSWLPELRKHGITQEKLLEGCTSIYVGAWILSKSIKRYGYSWEAIAAYNVGSVDTPRRRELGLRYAQRVYRNYDRFKLAYTSRSPAVAATSGSLASNP